MTSEAVHWGYTGSQGPERWGCLSSEFSLCSEGLEQSPINIAGAASGDFPSIRFAYSNRATVARNNGHTVYLDFPAGNTLAVGDRSYQLLGVHYHSPGEHEVAGEAFAAELHLVHQDGDGNLAVVGLLFRAGDASPLVQRLLDAAPDTGQSTDLADGPSAADFIPANLDYYGYDGSLTTPPCSEGVQWIVIQSVGTVSAEQARQLQALTGGPNNRPVQPVGERAIIAGGG